MFRSKVASNEVIRRSLEDNFLEAQKGISFVNL